MSRLPVSIIVVSRNRPQALIRCLMGISQLRYGAFEVVVVADPAGLDAIRRWPPGRHLKTVGFDEPNISKARNLGLAAAAGEVVAFVDDDAVPEPQWLTHLAAAFTDPSVGSAGGYVRGRNGISWQWRAQSVDLAGHAIDLSLDTDETVRLTPSPGRAIKTEGTNMAFRRDVIADLGGFDPNYHYFLDETDLNLRLAAAQVSTAIVPRAVVHHGFEENAARRKDRVPRDLTQLGASWAVFLARHCPAPNIAAVWQDIQTSERRRLIRHMVAGRLEPRDVRRLFASLRHGYQEGTARAPSALDPLPTAETSFRPLPSDPDREGITLSGRIWSAGPLRRKAEDAVGAGRLPSLYVFSPTTLYHRIVYRPEGFWEQRGGLFGKSLRSDPAFRLWRFRSRVAREHGLWSVHR